MAPPKKARSKAKSDKLPVSRQQNDQLEMAPERKGVTFKVLVENLGFETKYDFGLAFTCRKYRKD